jgi:hypothetical protein
MSWTIYNVRSINISTQPSQRLHSGRVFHSRGNPDRRLILPPVDSANLTSASSGRVTTKLLEQNYYYCSGYNISPNLASALHSGRVTILGGNMNCHTIIIRIMRQPAPSLRSASTVADGSHSGRQSDRSPKIRRRRNERQPGLASTSSGSCDRA